MNALTPKGIARNNALYAKLYPNWVTSYRDAPALSFTQAEWDEGVGLSSGSITVRRSGLKETAAALAALLDFHAVEKLIRKGLLSRDLAREFGALLEFGNHTVPFNLVAHSLGKARDGSLPKKLEKKPVPKTDKLVLLGLIFASKPGMLHFKAWYEDGGGHLDFEKDFCLPMMYYANKYHEEYPSIRKVPPGGSSFVGTVAPGPETPYARRKQEPAPAEYGPYPDVDIDAVIDVDAPEEGDGTPRKPRAPVVVGVSASGARIYEFPDSDSESSSDDEPAGKSSGAKRKILFDEAGLLAIQQEMDTARAPAGAAEEPSPEIDPAERARAAAERARAAAEAAERWRPAGDDEQSSS